MKEVIETLESWVSDIKYDLTTDWNDNKHLESVQLMKLESAIALLKSIGENRNISE